MRVTGFWAVLPAIACAVMMAAVAPAAASGASGGGAHDPAPESAPDTAAAVPQAPDRTLDVPADELADRAPAEPPPGDFTAAQFIDSAGCVFVRTPQGWRARVARDGSNICGYPPTFSARRLARDSVQPLFEQPVEPQAQKFERLLTEAIVPNLHSGELADPAPADQPVQAQAEVQAPQAAVAAAAVPVPQPAAAPAPAAARPDDPLGLAAAVSQAPLLAQDATPRSDRLCKLLGVAADPRGGLGGSSALGFCGGSDSVLAGTVVGGDAAAPAAARAGAAQRGGQAQTRIAAAGRGGPDGTPAAAGISPRDADKASGRAGTRTASGAAVRVKAAARADSRRAGAGRGADAGGTGRSAPAAAGNSARNAAALIPPGARYVQIGAFRDAANASRAAKQLSGMGLPVARSGSAGTQLIMVGPLSGREAIVRAIDRVRRAGFRDAYAR